MSPIPSILRVSMWLALLAAASAIPASAQHLADQILVRFPAETVRIEYAKSSDLRRLPEYAQLRTRFLGPRLQAMDAALADLGIQDTDIQEIAIGWRLLKRADSPDREEQETPEAPSPRDAMEDSPAPREWPMAIFGLVSGRFVAAQVAEKADANRVPRVPFGEREAHCTGAKLAEACLILLDESLAAFGDRESLRHLLEAREGRRSSLGADQRFTRLIDAANRGAAIWGIATGPSIVDGLLAWTPGRDQMQMPWSTVFERAQAMTYRVELSDRMNVAIRLECDSPESARLISGLLTALQSLQATLWRVQAPGRTNPLAAMEITSDYKVSILRLVTTSKTLLESALFPGPGNQAAGR